MSKQAPGYYAEKEKRRRERVGEEQYWLIQKQKRLRFRLSIGEEEHRHRQKVYDSRKTRRVLETKGIEELRRRRRVAQVRWKAKHPDQAQARWTRQNRKYAQQRKEGTLKQPEFFYKSQLTQARVNWARRRGKLPASKDTERLNQLLHVGLWYKLLRSQGYAEVRRVSRRS